MRTLASFYPYSKTQTEHVRVRVMDSGGTLRDLGTYPGFNALKSAQWGEKVNDATGSATVQVFREQGRLSLSPWMASSALNKGFDPSGSYAPLLALNRIFVIEVEVTPGDKPPSGVWVEFFRGRIESINPAAGDCVSFTGRDLAGRLAQQQIKEERVYSLADDSGLVSLRQWKPNTIYVTGDYLLPASRGTDDLGLNKFYSLSGGSGTASGLNEPAWNTSTTTDSGISWLYVGALSTGGHALEDVIQNILDDNVQSGDSAVTLYVPSSPGWFIKEYQQDRTFTLDAIRNLAHQCGADVRMKWDAGTSSFRLTLWFPERSVSSTAFTFTPDEYAAPSEMPIDIASIRNSWRGIYTDPTDVLTDGKSLGRKRVEVKDTASIAKYGELWAEIQEDASSQIDTSTEMTAMLNAALADCSEPTTQFSVDLIRGFPWVELGDFYKFAADNLRFSSDFDLAVTGYQHTFEQGRLQTRLELRGKPTIGHEWWMMLTVAPFMAPVTLAGQHQEQTFSGQKTPSTTLTAQVGGARISTNADVDKNARDIFYEHHIYTGSGSTLSGSTLHTVTHDRVTDVAHLTPGATYYHRLKPRWLDGGRLISGTATTEKSFIAGYVEPMHLNPEKFRGESPLNASFEAYSTTSTFSVPPDHWEMQTGTWATDVGVGPAKGGVDAKDGARYLRFTNTSVATAIRSKWFPVNGGNLHELRFWIHRTSMGNSVDFQVEWVTSTKTSISTSTQTYASSDLTDSAWNERSIVFTAPATAAFARCVVKKASANTDQFHVDGLRLTDLGEAWREIGGTGQPSFTNSWVNFGSNYTPLRFRKDNTGRVWIEGLVKSGTITASIFTLPAGYRPNSSSWKYIDSAGFKVDIRDNGAVTPQGGSNSAVWLDVSFLPDQ